MLKDINWSKVAKHIEAGYINVQSHPQLNLKIYNYSNAAQYDWVFDNETVQCRGLVVDADYNIILRPFTKIMTYDQLLSSRSHLWASHILRKIGTEPFKVQDKLDGSLGIVGKYHDELVVATRGSFTSEQALKAKEIIQRKYSTYQWLDGFTYLFEIIYPQNRIVCDYGSIEDIFLLAVIETSTRKELDIYTLDVPFPKVESYSFASFEELSNIHPPDKEGFVVTFGDGSRVKIKTEDYKLKHKILTSTNERTVWEFLKEGKSLDELLEVTDDIFYEFIRKTVKSLQDSYSAIETAAITKYNSILDQMPDGLSERQGRKVFAGFAVKTENPSLMFNLLDGKPLNNIIWGLLEPRFPKKAFNLVEDHDS